MRKFIAAAGATLLTGGLLAQTVTRDYDHSVDFSSLKKFGWIQRDTLPIFRADPSEHDPAADAALNRLILDSLKSRLEKKGFVLDEESPDFLVGYIGVSKYSLQSAEFGLDAQGGHRKRLSAQTGGQGFTFDVLHRDEVNAVTFTNLVDMRHVRMFDGRRGFRFPYEALQALGILGEFGW